MSILPSTTAAARLVQLRIKLLGEGAFRIERHPDAISALAILPGREFSVRMSLTLDGKHFGRIAYPTGRPLTALANLADPQSFATFLHTVDLVTFDSSKHPWEVSRLINAVNGTLDGRIQTFIKTLYNEGTLIDIPNLADWVPTSSLLTLIGDCLMSEDDECRMAAEILDEIVKKRRGPEAFNWRQSQIQWNQQIDRWIHQAHQREPIRLEVDDDMVWTDVATLPALTAACMSLGVRKSDIVASRQDSGQWEQTTDRSGALQARSSTQTRNGGVPTGEYFPEQLKDRCFLLLDNEGPLMLAHLKDELFLYSGKRANAFSENRINTALDYLVDHLREPGSELSA